MHEDMIKIKKILKSTMVKYDYKICILNPDDTINYELSPHDIIYDSISYSENLQNGQRKELSFNLINQSGKYTPSVNSQRGYYEIFYENDYNKKENYKINNVFSYLPLWGPVRMSFEIGLKISDTTYKWYKKGVFILNTMNEIENQGKKEISITLKDKFSLYEGKTGKILSAIEIPAGSNCVKVIKDLVRQDWGLGYSYDVLPLFIHSSFYDFKTSNAIKKEAGDTISSIFGDLATQMNAEYYYNDEGRFCWDPINETLLDEHKPICYEFNELDGDIIDISNNYNFDEAVNMIKVVGNNINDKIHYALAVNDDPRSPISVGNIGKRLGDIVSDINVWSDQIAFDTARYYLKKNTLGCITTDLAVKINPLIELNKLIVVIHKIFNYKKEKFIVNSISFSTGSFEMKIGISNIQHLTFLKAGDKGYEY